MGRRATEPLLFASVVAAAIAAGGPARAAGEMGFGLSYDARVPLGSFRDFVSDPGWQGFQGSLDYFPIDAVSVGVAVQYELFRQDFPTQTMQIPNGAITSEVFRHAAVWSIFPVARAYLLPRAVVRPYLALGVGPVDVIHNAQASDVVVSNDRWALMVQPSAGVFYRIGPNPPYGLRDDPGFGVSASLSYAWTSSSFGAVSNLSSLGAQLGLYGKY